MHVKQLSSPSLHPSFTSVTIINFIYRVSCDIMQQKGRHYPFFRQRSLGQCKCQSSVDSSQKPVGSSIGRKPSWSQSLGHHKTLIRHCIHSRLSVSYWFTVLRDCLQLKPLGGGGNTVYSVVIFRWMDLGLLEKQRFFSCFLW